MSSGCCCHVRDPRSEPMHHQMLRFRPCQWMAPAPLRSSHYRGGFSYTRTNGINAPLLSRLEGARACHNTPPSRAPRQRLGISRHDDGAGEPARPARHDAFTPGRRRIFLKHLAKTGCIADAARLTGVGKRTVYNHQAKDEEFARHCELATRMAGGGIEQIAYERAVTGIDRAIRLRRSGLHAQALLGRAASPAAAGRRTRQIRRPPGLHPQAAEGLGARRDGARNSPAKSRRSSPPSTSRSRCSTRSSARWACARISESAPPAGPRSRTATGCRPAGSAIRD